MDGVPVPIHLSGGCSGVGSSTSESESTLSDSAKRRIIKSFTIPNAHCPVCGDSVFYYQNEYGSKVFFDELGPPWTKHPCTDSQKGKVTPRFLKEMPKSLRRRSFWVKFFPESFNPIIKGERTHVIEWNGFYKTPDDGYSEMIRFVTKSKLPTERLNLNTTYIANDDQGFLKLSIITKGKAPTLVVLTSTEKVHVWTEGTERTIYLVRKKWQPEEGSVRFYKNSDNDKTGFQDLEPIEESFHCPFCSSSFIDEDEFSVHMKKHWRNESLGILENMEFEEWMKLIIEKSSTNRE